MHVPLGSASLTLSSERASFSRWLREVLPVMHLFRMLVFLLADRTVQHLNSGNKGRRASLFT